MTQNTSRHIYHQNLSKYPTLSREEVADLYQIMDSGDEAQRSWAKETMIKHNLRLVLKVVNRWRLDHSTFEDAVQEGNRGLIRAVEKFDPSLGFAFSTYAERWIRFRVERYLGEQFQIVDVPVEMQKLGSKMKHTRERLLRTLDESEVTVERLAREMGEKVSDVRRAFSISQSQVCLDAQLTSDEGSDHHHFYGDDGHEVESTEKSILMQQVVKRIGELPAQQRDMIMRHYGLDGQREETLQEIGDTYGLTRERIRQLIKVGMERLTEYFQEESGRHVA